MTQKNQHIEDIFKNAFENHEVQPPSNMWETVESSLDNSKSVETVYAAAFKNARIAPAANLWKRISHTLFWRNFFTFKVNSFNAYYLGAALGVCGVSLASFFSPETSPELQTTVHKIEQIASVVNVESAENTEVQAEVDLQTQEDTQVQESDFGSAKQFVDSLQKPAKTKKNTTKRSVEKSEAKANSSLVTKETAKAAFNFAQVQIVGNAVICANSPSEYAIEGLPTNAVVDWKLPQEARSQFISTRKIAATFSKNGAFVLAANVKVGNETAKIELPLRVEEAVVPEIKGQRSVCEGSEKMLYSVNEAVNKEIIYQWELQRNAIIPNGNKYVYVNWNIAGKDTLTVTRINKTTGCSASNSIVVLIDAKPKMDFSMAANNAQEYEFWFVGDSRKIRSYNWTVEGTQYNSESFVHTAYGTNNSLVKLEITNKAGCKNSLQKEVAFGRNILFVPKSFSLSKREGFIPQTNTELRSYNIEIYNSKSEKVWSSAELQNGKPAKAWNGMVRNAPASKGKYMWRIEAVFNDGTPWFGVRQKDGKMQATGIFVVEE